MSAFFRKFALLAVLSAFAIGFSACSTSSPNEAGFVHTSNGITVSSTQSSDLPTSVDLPADSMPMLHDTTQLFDDLGANDLSMILRRASSARPTSLSPDHRSFRSLEGDAR